MPVFLLTVMRHIEKQVVKNEAQVGLACAVVGQREALATRRNLLKQRRYELVEVIDLLELAPGILVELALAREDVQFLEQLDGLARPKLFNDLWRCRGLARRFAGGFADAWRAVVLHGPPV